MARVLELSAAAAAALRSEISRARGNEVCFIAGVDEAGVVQDARAVARGHGRAVLAAARDAAPGALLIHNHPSGDLTPSNADLEVAAENVEVSREASLLAAEVLERITAQYAVGEARVLDVTEAEVQRTRARLEHLRSQIEHLLAQARLRRALGLAIDAEGEVPEADPRGVEPR